MQKIYTASWNLFTLTVEADRVFCQLVMFFTVFFHWIHKMKYSCYQCNSLLLFTAGLFIEFLVEKCAACQSWKSDFGWHRFRFSPSWMRVEKSLRRFWPYLIAFRSRLPGLYCFQRWTRGKKIAQSFLSTAKIITKYSSELFNLLARTIFENICLPLFSIN